jgi:DNA-directed RNA polymerase alpha subunit
MSDLSIPTWLEPRMIGDDDHEELVHLTNGLASFCFRDITKELIVKFYNKYPRDSFFRLLRVLGFYGVRFTGKISAYSGPKENYPEVMLIDRTHWEEKIILPEVLPILAAPFRSFGLSKIKQLHGVPVKSVVALSGNQLFHEKIPAYFHASIIKVNDVFFAAEEKSISCEFSSEIKNAELPYRLHQPPSTYNYTAAECTINEYSDQRLSQPIEMLQLSSESLAILQTNNVNYIGELVAKNDEEVAAMFHHRKRVLKTIKVRLWLIGLSIGLKTKTIRLDSVPTIAEKSESLDVETMGLSVRSANCLRQANIMTISELLSKNEKELLAIPHFGKKCLNEIRSKLDKIQPISKTSKGLKFLLEETEQHSINVAQEEIFLALKNRVKDIVLSVRARKCLEKMNIEYIWQLAQVSEKQLLESRNLGKKTINELREVLGDFGLWFGITFTSNHLASIHDFKSSPKSLDLGTSIKQVLMKASVLPIAFLNERENQIVEERFFHFGKKKTLEELATQYSLTRERIRQIEKSATKTIKQHHRKELTIIIDTLKSRVENSAGLADLNALGIDKRIFSSKERIIASRLLYLMDKDIFIDWEFDLISIKGEEWIVSICDAIELQINQSVAEKFFREEDLFEAVKRTCASIGLSSEQYIQNLAKRFHLEKGVKNLDNFLCCGRVTKQDQIILAFKELFPEGLEVYKKQNLLIEKLCASNPATFNGTSPRAILGRLTDHPDVFLWRRGFFIHKDHTIYDEEIVEKIVDWIEQRFEQGHSRFQVDVAFNTFKDDLLHAGVPNQYALYTLIRLQQNPRIGQRKYPTIVDMKADIDIQEGILDELENYFLQARKPVPYSLLKNEFIIKRGWKIYSLQQNITTHSDVIYPWRDGSYIHIEYMTIDYAKLEDLLNAFRLKLNTIQGAYSLKGARKEMNVLWEQACPSASIRTMSKLIRSVDPDDLQIERYFIQSVDQLTDNVSSALELEDFCLEKAEEVNSHELHEEFCRKRGWSESQYYPVIRKANLFRSGKSTYLHPMIINWDESLSQLVHQVMDEYLDVRIENHCPHMQIEDLIYQYALPELPNDIQWTRYLLKSVCKEFGDFLFFDDAYIAIDNEFDIEDLDDMIGFLIGRHFRFGIGKRIEVEQLLWREGIIESGKSIPADQFFKESSIVFLTESDEISLSPSGIKRYAQPI